MQTFGSVFFTGILLRGLTSICPSKVDLLNVHPREKPFQTLGHKKNYSVLLFFVFCCQKIIVHKGLLMETFGSIFFSGIPLRGLMVYSFLQV